MKTIEDLFAFAKERYRTRNMQIPETADSIVKFYADCAGIAQDNQLEPSDYGTSGTRYLIDFMLSYINNFLLEGEDMMYVKVCKSEWNKPKDTFTIASLERSLETMREINFNLAERKARLKESLNENNKGAI